MTPQDLTTQEKLQAIKDLRALEEANAAAKPVLSNFHRMLQADKDRKEARSLRKRLAKLAEKN